MKREICVTLFVMPRQFSGQPEQVELYRGSRVVSSLASAQGRGLRETRLTALLGYLVALEPGPFLKQFQFLGQVRNVTIEHHEEDGRSDIRVKTDRGDGVVEAKITPVDARVQAAKYPARWRVLLTTEQTTAIRHVGHNVLHLNWQHLTDQVLKKLATNPHNHRVRFVAEDLIRYLEEHHMVNRADPVEIYARELNDEQTVTMFLYGQAYGCWYEKNSRLPEAMYFAPHFGKSIARQIPGIQSGICYIAKIIDVRTVVTWDEFRKAIKAGHSGSHWNSHEEIYQAIRTHWKWKNNDKARSIILLDPPRLVFNPPIKKDNLQKGKGWLSKRFFSFDTLFEAWKK